MPFWDPNNFQEPLRQNRWFLEIPFYESLKYALKKCSKPEYDISVSEHRLLNHTFKYPGVLTWKPIEVSIISYLNKDEFLDASTILYEELFSSYYNSDIFNTRPDNYDVFGFLDVIPDRSGSRKTKERLASNFKKLSIVQTSTDGKELERWTLYNAWISNVKFGNLDYDSEEIVTIDFTIQYDWAEKPVRKNKEIDVTSAVLETKISLLKQQLEKDINKYDELLLSYLNNKKQSDEIAGRIDKFAKAAEAAKTFKQKTFDFEGTKYSTDESSRVIIEARAKEKELASTTEKQEEELKQLYSEIDQKQDVDLQIAIERYNDLNKNNPIEYEKEKLTQLSDIYKPIDNPAFPSAPKPEEDFSIPDMLQSQNINASAISGSDFSLSSGNRNASLLNPLPNRNINGVIDLSSEPIKLTDDENEDSSTVQSEQSTDSTADSVAKSPTTERKTATVVQPEDLSARAKFFASIDKLSDKPDPYFEDKLYDMGFSKEQVSYLMRNESKTIAFATPEGKIPFSDTGTYEGLTINTAVRGGYITPENFNNITYSFKDDAAQVGGIDILRAEGPIQDPNTAQFFDQFDEEETVSTDSTPAPPVEFGLDLRSDEEKAADEAGRERLPTTQPTTASVTATTNVAQQLADYNSGVAAKIAIWTATDPKAAIDNAIDSGSYVYTSGYVAADELEVEEPMTESTGTEATIKPLETRQAYIDEQARILASSSSSTDKELHHLLGEITETQKEADDFQSAVFEAKKSGKDTVTINGQTVSITEAEESVNARLTYRDIVLKAHSIKHASEQSETEENFDARLKSIRDVRDEVNKSADNVAKLSNEELVAADQSLGGVRSAMAASAREAYGTSRWSDILTEIRKIEAIQEIYKDELKSRETTPDPAPAPAAVIPSPEEQVMFGPLAPNKEELAKMKADEDAYWGETVENLSDKSFLILPETFQPDTSQISIIDTKPDSTQPVEKQKDNAPSGWIRDPDGKGWIRKDWIRDSSGRWGPPPSNKPQPSDTGGHISAPFSSLPDWMQPLSDDEFGSAADQADGLMPFDTAPSEEGYLLAAEGRPSGLPSDQATDAVIDYTSPIDESTLIPPPVLPLDLLDQYPKNEEDKGAILSELSRLILDDPYKDKIKTAEEKMLKEKKDVERAEQILHLTKITSYNPNYDPNLGRITDINLQNAIDDLERQKKEVSTANEELKKLVEQSKIPNQEKDQKIDELRILLYYYNLYNKKP